MPGCTTLLYQLKGKQSSRKTLKETAMGIGKKFLFKQKGFRNIKKESHSHLYLIRYQTIPNIKQKSTTSLTWPASMVSQLWRKQSAIPLIENSACYFIQWFRIVKLHCFQCFYFSVNLGKTFKTAKLTFQGSKLFFKVQQLEDKNFSQMWIITKTFLFAGCSM